MSQEDNPRILIVEDDPDLSEMLTAYFKVQNYDVVAATFGHEALQLANEVPPALVMLDIRLPDVDGFEVCRQLRLNRRTQTTPIIFLTEKRARVDKLHGLELGVVDYITKPFDVQELRLRVRNAIARAARQTSLNPVTELPEHHAIQAQLSSLLYDESPWALLLIAVTGLAEFRERYGFVAADDVMRAVSLMVRNAVRDLGNETDFVGHLGPEDFIIVTTQVKASGLRDRISHRVTQSRTYFYPTRDHETTHFKPDVEYFGLKTAILPRSDYADVETMVAALLGAAT